MDLGNYTVTETTKDIDGKEHTVKYSVNGAAQADGKAASAEVRKNETTTVEFEDNFTNKPGILEITKTIKGDITAEEAAGALTFVIETPDHKFLKADGTLADTEVEFDNGATCCVVIASGGYPVSYKSGYVISGLEAAGENALVIHAGTKLNENGDIVTAGGRVLGVVGRCKCLPGAISKAYEAAKKISFTDLHMRSDIGQRGLAAMTD